MSEIEPVNRRKPRPGWGRMLANAAGGPAVPLTYVPPPKAIDPSPARTPNRDLYSLNAVDAFHRPVISTQAAAEFIHAQREAVYAAALQRGRPKTPLASVEEIEAGLRQTFPGGLMSMQHVAREAVIGKTTAQWSGVADRTGKPYPSDFAGKWSDSMRAYDNPTDADLNVLKVLSGDDKRQDTPEYFTAMQLRQLVQQHAPGGQYAKYGGRPEAEDAALHATMGDNAYHRVTPETRQNLEAQRVSELFRAADDYDEGRGQVGYMPASGFSQVMRAIGGTAGPLVDAVRSVTTEPGVFDPSRLGEAHSDMIDMMQPDGKYLFASRLWNAGEGERGTPDDLNTYTQGGQAKYLTHNPTTPEGFAAATSQNTSFPVARGYANLAPIREAATLIGYNGLGGGNIDIEGLRQMRIAGGATQQVTPQGMKPEEAKRMFDKLNDSDTKMEGWISAYHGPAWTDAENQLFGTNRKRTYASPMYTAVLETPAEIFGDPTNMAMNITTGPLWGVAKGGVTGALKSAAVSPTLYGGLKQTAADGIRGLAKGTGTMMTRFGDDVVEEAGAENAAINGPMMGLDTFIRPETNNLMMGTKNPNDGDYWDKFQTTTAGALGDREEVSQSWRKARQRK